MPAVLDLLRGGRQIVADPSLWTQGEYARQENGEFCSVASPAAKCFCSVGAIRKASIGLGIGPAHGTVMLAENRLWESSQELHKMTILDVNDKFGREAALAVFDHAIRREEETQRWRT